MFCSETLYLCREFIDSNLVEIYNKHVYQALNTCDKDQL